MSANYLVMQASGLFEAAGEPVSLRIFHPDPDDGKHYIIFQDRLEAAHLEDRGGGDWTLTLLHPEYVFRWTRAEVGDVKVNPRSAIWLGTRDRQWIFHLFRWGQLLPHQPFQPYIPQAWRAENPPNRHVWEAMRQEMH